MSLTEKKKSTNVFMIFLWKRHSQSGKFGSSRRWALHNELSLGKKRMEAVELVCVDYCQSWTEGLFNFLDTNGIDTKMSIAEIDLLAYAIPHKAMHLTEPHNAPGDARHLELERKACCTSVHAADLERDHHRTLRIRVVRKNDYEQEWSVEGATVIHQDATAIHQGEST